MEESNESVEPVEPKELAEPKELIEPKELVETLPGHLFSHAKPIVILLSILWTCSIIFLLVFNILIPAYHTARSSYTEDEGIDLNTPPPSEQATKEPLKSYAAFAVTDPKNPNDMLNGSVAYDNGTMYYRAWQNGYRLARRDPNGKETVLVHDVKPAFITLCDGYVYFCDAQKGYSIMRVSLDGEPMETISEHCASFLQTDDRYLYFTNHDDRDRLYQLDLETQEEVSVTKRAAYETVLTKDAIYYLDGIMNFNLYRMDAYIPYTAASDGIDSAILTDENKYSNAFQLLDTLRLNEVNCANLRLSDDKLFFIDLADGTIRCMTANGREVAFNCPIRAKGFDIDGIWLCIIELETLQLYIYNMETGERRRISDKRTAYVQVEKGMIDAVDYNDCRIMRRFTLP